MTLPKLFRTATFVTAALVVSHLTIGDGHANAQPIPETILVGVPAEFPPYYILDDHNRIQGYAVEMIEALAASLGYKLKYQVYDSWDATMAAVAQDKVHLIPNVGITEGRQRYIRFSDPLDSFGVSVFVQASKHHVNRIEDLKNETIGVVKRNVAQRIVESHPDYRVEVFDSLPDSLLALLSGKISAVAYPEPVMWNLIDAAGLAGSLKVLQPTLTQVHRGIGVNPNYPALHTALQRELTTFVESGQHLQIRNKWFSPTATAAPITRSLTSITLLLAGGITAISLFTAFYLYRKLRAERTKHRSTEDDTDREN